MLLCEAVRPAILRVDNENDCERTENMIALLSKPLHRINT